MNATFDLFARRYCRRLPILSLFAAIGIAVPSGMFVNVQADEHEKKVESWKKSYEEKILPIVEARCVQCHRGDGSGTMSGTA